jgi:CRP-like cAMP-binding protein
MELDCLFALSSFPLFAALGPRQLESLLDSPSCFGRRYRKGQLIHLKGDACTHLDCMVEGTVALLEIDEDGGCMQVGTCDRHAVYGAPLLFSSDNRYPVTVEAKTPSVVVHVGQKQVLSLCAENGDYVAALLRLVSDRALFLADTIDSIRSKTIRQRLLEYLQAESCRQGSRQVMLSGSKEDLALRFGVRRSSLVRELGKMRDDGLLLFDRKSITLLE